MNCTTAPVFLVGRTAVKFLLLLYALGGTSFISFKEYYAEREIFDYIRSMRTGFTVQSLAEYAKLRKAMAVWDKYDRSYTDATIEAVAAELRETADDTKEILFGGLLNENRVDLYQQYAEDDEEETTRKHTPIPPPTLTRCI